MITNLYRRLALGGTELEASPATALAGDNSVQLTAVVTSAAGAVDVFVQQSNDAENWTAIGVTTNLAGPGLYVMSPVTNICTRYMRVAFQPTADGIVVLAATQRTMQL